MTSSDGTASDGCGNTTTKYKSACTGNKTCNGSGQCVENECTPNDCSDYTLTYMPQGGSGSYDSCTPGCGDDTPKYKCRQGYTSMSAYCVKDCPSDHPKFSFYNNYGCSDGICDYIENNVGYCLKCGRSIGSANVGYRCPIGANDYIYNGSSYTGYPNGCCIKDPCASYKSQGYTQGITFRADNGGYYWCCMPGYTSEPDQYSGSNTAHCKYAGVTGTNCLANYSGNMVALEQYNYCTSGTLSGNKCVVCDSSNSGGGSGGSCSCSATATCSGYTYSCTGSGCSYKNRTITISGYGCSCNKTNYAYSSPNYPEAVTGGSVTVSVSALAGGGGWTPIYSGSYRPGNCPQTCSCTGSVSASITN